MKIINILMGIIVAILCLMGIVYVASGNFAINTVWLVIIVLSIIASTVSYIANRKK